VQVERSGPQDYFGLLRRRRASMFIVFATVSIATIFGTQLLNDQYLSTARIAIERAEIPENMIRTTVINYDTDLRIDRIRDRVLAEPNVEAWISEFNLYEDLIARKSVRAAVLQFRRDVEVITIQAREGIAVQNQGETVAFDLSFYGETPAKAVQVTESLANQFLDENRSSRSQSVGETLAYFQRDADRKASKIEETEIRLAEFKELHPGALPQSTTVNTQMLDRTEGELDDVEREIRDLRAARQIFETDLAKESPTSPIFTSTGEVVLAGPDRLKFLQQQLIELSSKYGPEHPDVIRTKREIELMDGGTSANDTASIQRELEVARREYQAAQQRYSNDHPDVRGLANRIDILQARLANSAAAAPTITNTQPDNPAYMAILAQIESTDVEIQALRSRAQSLRQRIGRYESLMLEAPQVEREYLAIERAYEQAVKDYNEVREKQIEAQQAHELEASEKGERYVLQRMPQQPETAAFPNRLAITILGIIFAVGCAFAAVVIREALDATVRGARDLKNITGMPPIAVIPVLASQSELRKNTLVWSLSLIGLTSLIVYTISSQIS
jgi:succinoglycan biosynthesis transport protein ExoP